MKILRFTQLVLRVNGILPIFTGSNRQCNKYLETIRLSIALISPSFVLLTCFSFLVVYLDDISKMTMAAYLCVGYTMGIAIHVNLFLNANEVEKCLRNMEAQVNRRTQRDRRDLYEKVDNRVASLTKKLLIISGFFLFPMLMDPFFEAFLDYVRGKYSAASWKLIYDTILVPYDLNVGLSAMGTILVQCIGAVFTVSNMLVPQLLLLAILFYKSAYIDDVKSVIKEFDATNIGNEETLKLRFIEAIHLHRDTLGLLDHFAKIMNGTVFIVNTFNLICICSVLFQLQHTIETGNYTDLHRSLVANVFILQLVFAFCYMGDLFTGKIAEINGAIYNALWYYYPAKIQILCVLIMMRSQKPYVLTGYSLVTCSLRSFKEMLSFAGSAYLLLQEVDA